MFKRKTFERLIINMTIWAADGPIASRRNVETGMEIWSDGFFKDVNNAYINRFSSHVRYLQQLFHLCSTCFILLCGWNVNMKHMNLDAMYLNQSKHGKMSFVS